MSSLSDVGATIIYYAMEWCLGLFIILVKYIQYRENMTIKRKILSISILSVLSNNSLAQNITLFDEIVVSATRTEQKKQDVSGSISSISTEQMQNKMASNVKEALRDVPGVTANGSGRFGMSGFNIRGMDDSRVKVLVDGVQQPVPYDPGSNEQRKYPNMIELDSLVSIEVNKGPSSTLYGSDALGGVVLMRTFNPDDLLKTDENENAFSIKSGYSSIDSSVKTTLSWARRQDKLETLLMLTYKQGSEVKTHRNGADIEGEDRGQADPATQKLGNLLSKAYYQINSAHRIGATLEYYNAQYDENELSMQNYTMLPGFSYKDNYNEDESIRLRVGIEHQWQAENDFFDVLNWHLNLQKTQTNSDNYDTTYGFSPYVSGRRLRERNAQDNSLQLEMQFDKLLVFDKSDHQLTYGMSFIDNHFSTENIDYKYDVGTISPGNTNMPDATLKQWGVFVQDQMFLLKDRFILTAGLRYDSFQADPSSNAGFDRETESNKSDAFTAKLGSVYHVNENLSAFAQISQGFKAPTVYDLYYFYDTGAVIDANPDLKPESSTSYELGLRMQSEYSQIELISFYNDYSDLITKKYLGKVMDEGQEKDHYSKVNIDKAEIYGLEFSSKFLLDKILNAPQGSYSKFNIAYIQGRNKVTNASLDTIAPLTANFGLGYDALNGDFGGVINLQMVNRKDNWEDSNIRNVAGYSLVDITVYYQAQENLKLTAGLFNAFDKQYWLYDDVSGFESEDKGLDRKSQAGRNWKINMQWDF